MTSRGQFIILWPESNTVEDSSAKVALAVYVSENVLAVSEQRIFSNQVLTSEGVVPHSAAKLLDLTVFIAPLSSVYAKKCDFPG